MRRRQVIGAATTGVALLAAACSSSSAPTTASTAPSAQQYLLRNGDLPTGWTLDNTAPSPSDSCYYEPLSKVPSQSYAHVNFAQAGGLPQLAEELALFPTARAAASGFTVAKADLDGCKTFTETVNTETISGSLNTVPSSAHGANSAAYDAMLTIGGRPINQGFLLVQQGRGVIIVALAGTGPLDSVALQGYVDQATAKLPS